MPPRAGGKGGEIPLVMRDFALLAEGEGFEPSSDRNGPKRFSRPPHSTTLPPLRDGARGRLAGAGEATAARSYTECMAATVAPTGASRARFGPEVKTLGEARRQFLRKRSP